MIFNLHEHKIKYTIQNKILNSIFWIVFILILNSIHINLKIQDFQTSITT